MMSPLSLRPALALLLLLSAAALPACDSNAINKDARDTFLDSTDLTLMTDLMAQSIVADPDVAMVTAQKPMIIVLLPVENKTAQIIPQREKDLYVHRVRVLLAQKQQLRSRFRFVLNRTSYQNLLQEEGAANLGPTLDPQGNVIDQSARLVPEYVLTATFDSLTNASSSTRSDAYLCAYRLTHMNTGQLLWEDKYETKKIAKKSLLD